MGGPPSDAEDLRTSWEGDAQSSFVIRNRSFPSRYLLTPANHTHRVTLCKPSSKPARAGSCMR
jgi:hypothetical protein